MRRLLLLLLLAVLTVGLRVQGANIKFLQVIPENGSEISTFDIKLKFDISEAITESGNENIKIGYSGTSTNNTKIYDGNAETGTLITTVLTKTVKGVDYSNDYIDLGIPSSFVPEAGHTYTVVFANQVAMFNEDGKTVSNSVIAYKNDPLIFTFYGKSAGSEELLFQKASVANNDNLDNISSVVFEFSGDIAIPQAKQISIYKGEELIASSKSIEIDPENSKALRATFDELTLYLGNEYAIRLPEGIVTLKNDAAVLNKPVEIKVNGTSTIRLSTKSSSPDNNTTVLPDKATIKFNLEEGQTLTPKEGIDHKRGIDFYKDEISEENFIMTLFGTASGDGISWDLSNIKFEPATKYILRKKADDITVWVNGKSQPEYGNEEVIICFTTPSVDELGFPPITLGTAKIGRYDDESVPDFIDGGTYGNINTLEIMRVEYVHNGKTYKPNLEGEGEKKAYIYDVTDGSRVPVKEITMAIDGRGGDDNGGLIIRDYSVFIIRPQMEFLQDHTYQIVIPKGVIRLSSVLYPNLYNYVMNDEIVYTVKGVTPTVFTVDGCSVENNVEMSSLPPVIVWTLNGAYELKNSEVTADGIYSGTATGITKLPMTIKKEGYKTYVAVHLIDTKTGNNRPFSNGHIFTVTIPAGSIVYPGEESLSNPALTVSVKGIEEIIPAPETVNVKLNIDGLHTSTHPATEGKTYQFTLEPAENWKVESVMQGEKQVDPIVGTNTYILSALKGDTELTAHLEYTGNWASNDESTGVWEIEDKNIRIYGDSDHIVVDGVTPENTICVYNVAGMLINSTRVSEGNDRVLISVPLGPTYIVTVDGIAAKIVMKK